MSNTVKRRVVITGMGAISPIGNNCDELWQSILDGKCGIGYITAFNVENQRVKLAAEVKDIDMDAYFDKRELKFNDRFTKFARIAAKQAFQDSGLTETADDHGKLPDSDRMGVILSSGIGGIASIENAEKVLEQRGPGKVSPYFIPMCLVNLAAGSVAIDLGANAHCSSIVTACAASTNAIGEAFRKIRDGYADIMVSGGSEASITPLAIAGFASMRALNEGTDPMRASIPFDKERGGFVMGEGAGVIILEELEHARNRGAKIHGEIVGYGDSCDAFHITAPIDDGSGGALAMENALKDGGIAPEQISYINAHGTGTPMNDKIETLAIKKAFGDHAENLAVSSTKSNTGHLLGASGAIEAIITILSLKEGFVPPTVNHRIYDDECDLNIVANNGYEQDMTYAMSNSLGFGGHNGSLVFKRWEGEK
ncbi:3-oxoacyl-[acyl-carrier-protein] synthase II [Peptostreptococcaceae bacterium pGA-8]|nr:3-oxoacyl-[acyl-carrier-protein] synthase II [Peptostreptococcaceae bacterium pGA-8]